MIEKYSVDRGYKMSVLAIRLAKKIEAELGIKCDPSTFRRTYAGYWQKASGAWVWAIRVSGTPFEIGSGDTATMCVNKKYKLCLTTGGHSREITAELIREDRKDD